MQPFQTCSLQVVNKCCPPVFSLSAVLFQWFLDKLGQKRKVQCRVKQLSAALLSNNNNNLVIYTWTVVLHVVSIRKFWPNDVDVAQIEVGPCRYSSGAKVGRKKLWLLVFNSSQNGSSCRDCCAVYWGLCSEECEINRDIRTLPSSKSHLSLTASTCACCVVGGKVINHRVQPQWLWGVQTKVCMCVCVCAYAHI